MAYRYYIGFVHLTPGRGFVASFPDLPGFEAVGPSVDEAKTQARSALTPHLRSLFEGGKSVPRSEVARHVAPRRQPVGEFRILVRGDIPGETPFDLIRENARRLANDAHTMFDLGSMATCVALAIAAIEEAGKFIIHHEEGRDVQSKGKLLHERKQAVLGRAFDRLFLLEALAEMVKDYEEHLRSEDKDDLLQQFLALSEREKFALVHDSVKDFPKLLKREIKRVAGPDEFSIEYSREVRRRRVSDKREQASYVDFDDRGHLRPTPFDITFDEADAWLQRADFAVHLADSVILEGKNQA